MRINELCKELNIPLIGTRLSYSKHRGNVLCWSLKELLLAEYYRLQTVHRDMLTELFVDLVTEKLYFAHGKSDAFVKGQFVLPDNYLQRLLVSYSAGNPFGDIL